MTISTAMTIASNFPDNILINSAQQQDGKFKSFMYLLRDGEIHRTLLSTFINFDTAEEAEKIMKDSCTAAVVYIENLNA